MDYEVIGFPKSGKELKISMKPNFCKTIELSNILTTSSILQFITLHLKTKCQQTYIHSMNVASYASQLAALLIPNEINIVKIAGLL
ncbi:MAG: HD domain-containing protein, partial [Smithella sp.]